MPETRHIGGKGNNQESEEETQNENNLGTKRD